MDHKDSTNELEQLKYIMNDHCSKCRVAYPGIDCSRCRTLRYYKKVAQWIKERQ